KLEQEKYLSFRDRCGGPEITKLRGGTNRLRIEQGRYRGEPVEDRVCEYCSEKEVEDERHFMLSCPVYQRERESMLLEVERLTGTQRGEYKTDDELLDVLIGEKFRDHPKFGDLIRVVMNFVKKSMKIRKDLEGVKLTEVGTVRL